MVRPGSLFTYHPFCLGFFSRKSYFLSYVRFPHFEQKRQFCHWIIVHTVNGICLVGYLSNNNNTLFSSENNCMSGFACLVVGLKLFFHCSIPRKWVAKCIRKTTVKMDICSIKSTLTLANRRTKKSNFSLLSVESVIEMICCTCNRRRPIKSMSPGKENMLDSFF